MSEQRSSSAEVGMTWYNKRKASHDGRTLTKKRRFSEGEVTDKESGNTSVKEVTTSKRKAVSDGERPNREKTRRLSLEDPTQQTGQDVSTEALRAKFEAKYEQLDLLGQGGCGCVYAGYRRADNVPVAIKHVLEDHILYDHKDHTGRLISNEVSVMLRLQYEAGGSVGASAPVSLMDWYDLDQELILVHERPVPAKDLLEYIDSNGGSLPEEEAKIILEQLVEAVVHLQDTLIFHRDIKVENILIETGSDVPRVRLIDFGLSCFAEKWSSYKFFYGTSAHNPPECDSRGRYRAGPATVWQMGVVLFETLHTRVDFQTGKFMENLLPISETLSKNCQYFLRACLSEDPDQRPSLKQIRRHPWLRNTHTDADTLKICESIQ